MIKEAALLRQPLSQFPDILNQEPNYFEFLLLKLNW